MRSEGIKTMNGIKIGSFIINFGNFDETNKKTNLEMSKNEVEIFFKMHGYIIRELSQKLIDLMEMPQQFYLMFKSVTEILNQANSEIKRIRDETLKNENN